MLNSTEGVLCNKFFIFLSGLLFSTGLTEVCNYIPNVRSGPITDVVLSRGWKFDRVSLLSQL